MTEDEKSTCREIAREIVKEALIQYTVVCPHGRTILKAKWYLIGAVAGFGVVNGGVFYGLIKLFS